MLILNYLLPFFEKNTKTNGSKKFDVNIIDFKKSAEMMMERDGQDDDLALARRLQSQFDEEFAHEEVVDLIPEAFRTPSKNKQTSKTMSLVAPEWEDVDPTPDLHAMFLQFNAKFFWGRLVGCEVKWSPRMTVCAGVCSYQRRAGYCSIR